MSQVFFPEGLTESSSFMNALSSQAAKWHEKRVKKIKAADRAKGLSKVNSIHRVYMYL